MWHHVSSSLNKQKIRKSKVDKSDLLDTFGPSESLWEGGNETGRNGDKFRLFWRKLAYKIRKSTESNPGGIDPKSFEWYLYHIKDRIGIRRKKEKNQRRALELGVFETGKLNLNTADNFQFFDKILDQIPRSMLTRT